MGNKVSAGILTEQLKGVFMKKKLVVLSMFFLVICGNGAYAAYFHMGEADAPKFQQAYPDLKGFKA